MKTLTILTMVCLFAFATQQSQAQDLANLNNQKKENTKDLKSKRKELRKLFGNSVSIVSKNNFVSDFGSSLNPIWIRTKNFDEALFTQNGQKMTAYYDYDSKLVGTTTTKIFANIPVKAQNEIKDKYKGYSIGVVTLFDDNELNESDMLLWDNQFDDVDNYFVELLKGKEKLILRVDMDANVSFFKKL